jgi:hypothetical protein
VPDRDVRDALAVVAATNLSTRHVPLPPLPAEVEDDFLRAVSRERLTGLTLAAAAAGILLLSDGATDDLIKRHEDQLALDLRLERLLLETTAALRRSGVTYRALKGPVLAHTVYSDPSLRSFGDIDVLVSPEQFDIAIHTLNELGFVRRFVEPRAGFDARFAKGACLEHADGLEVDLHRTLAPGAFGMRIAQHDLFAAPARNIDLGGVTISAVGREIAFMHACFHAALGDYPPRLVPIRDIVECHRAGIDEHAVIDVASSVHCEVVFQRAISLVDSVLQVQLDGTWARWARVYEPTAFDRWALRSYTTADRSYSRQLAASFCALTGFRERVSYVAALAFPSKTYVRAREGNYAARLTRGIREVRNGAMQ